MSEAIEGQGKTKRSAGYTLLQVVFYLLKNHSMLEEKAPYASLVGKRPAGEGDQAVGAESARR